MPDEISSVGKAPNISHDQTSIIYDKSTGAILHTHRLTVATKDKTRITDQDLEHRALSAAEHFLNRDQLASAAVLSVDPNELAKHLARAPDKRAQLHIDVASKRLAWVKDASSAE